MDNYNTNRASSCVATLAVKTNGNHLLHTRTSPWASLTADVVAAVAAVISSTGGTWQAARLDQRQSSLLDTATLATTKDYLVPVSFSVERIANWQQWPDGERVSFASAIDDRQRTGPRVLKVTRQSRLLVLPFDDSLQRLWRFTRRKTKQSSYWARGTSRKSQTIVRL